MTTTQKRRIAMKALDKAIKRLKRMKKHSFLSPEYGKLFDEYLYFKKFSICMIRHFMRRAINKTGYRTKFTSRKEECNVLVCDMAIRNG